MNRTTQHILTAAFLLMATCFCASAQDSLAVRKKTAKPEKPERKELKVTEYSDTYLDTVQLRKVFVLNDYSMIGVEYGASGSMTMFTPPKKQGYIIAPSTMGVYYTKYGKLFNYLPYFGVKAGLRYSASGYKFKEGKETHVTPTQDGASQALIRVLDVPFMGVFHVDTDHFSVLADLGIYGGYRTSIDRIGDRLDAEFRNKFMEHEHRIDYGVTGGVGFALVFAPFEFQVNANVRYSWGTLYDCDYASKYYYRFAYPLDVMVTGGLYYHLTRRTGKSRPQIKREAYDRVYNPQKYENPDSEDRK